MELYKLEKDHFFQCFKIGQKIEEDGITYYKYSSIIIDPFGIRQMNNYMNLDDYNLLISTFQNTTQQEVLKVLTKKIPLENLDKSYIYKQYFQLFLKFYTAKRKSRIETDQQKKENNSLDFYETLEHCWQHNMVYELKDEVNNLMFEVRNNGNFIEQLILDNAFKDATHLYIANQIYIQ